MHFEDDTNIIVRFPNWLGDCIMALPFLEALYELNPRTRITVAARVGLARLLRNDPRLCEVIRVNDKQHWFRPYSYWKVARKLQMKRYNYGFILPDSLSSAYIFYAGHILERIGYEKEARSRYLTWEIPQPEKEIHRSQKYLNLLDEFGGAPGSNYFPQIFTNDKIVQKAEQLLSGISRFAVIAPQTRAASRRWGAEKYARLAARIKNELSLDVVLIGAPDEIQAVSEVAELSGVECLNTAGRSDLLDSYEIMKRALVYVGNDSGGAHLAGASGTYTISISGADDPSETHPLIKQGKIIKKDIPCSPCVKNVCPRRDHPNECMDLISVDEVLAAVREAVG